MAERLALLDRFAGTLAPTEASLLSGVSAFVEWQAARRGVATLPSETPSADDDVDLRTYLLHLQNEGADRTTLRRAMAALKHFYAWVRTEGVIAANPFDEFDFDRPILSRDQIRRRVETAGTPHEREIARLRALNQLAEHLNRAPSLRDAFDYMLETLLKVMGLRAAWAFVLTEADLAPYLTLGPAPHDFALAATCGLPPGLDQNERYYLTCPPNCHCQSLLRSGRLTRAVNVVECTRLLDSAEANGDNGGLLFHATVPILSAGKPLGILNVATEEWQFLAAADLQLLSAAGAQLAIALERARLYELSQAQRLRLERELDMARTVQASLLPRPLPSIPGFSLAADWRSAHEVAGDFYDVFALTDRRWGLVIADVSDKGAPAALYMAMVRSLIRSIAVRTRSPAATLLELNDALLAQCSAEMFVTVFYAVLDPTGRALTYANAGHNPPLVRRATGQLETLPKTGPLIGILDEVILTERMLELKPGDSLVLYTDGLTDAENARRTGYGSARLAASLASAPASGPGILTHLLADLAAFTGNVLQPDDITLFVVMSEMEN